MMTEFLRNDWLTRFTHSPFTCYTEVSARTTALATAHASNSPQNPKENLTQVATYTRRQLKQDKFITAAQTTGSWMEENRAAVAVAGVAVLVVIGIAIGGYLMYQARSEKAAAAFGAALKTYQSPIRPINAPPDPSTESYANAQERAQAANKAFLAVADQYSTTQDGRNARYYAGLTYEDLGQNASAEDSLKKAEGGSQDISNLAKVALASLYHSTGRDPQAITEYNDVIAHPSTTVPVNLGKLDLASFYESTGNMAEARKLWAQVKDADKTGAAGQIATEKLSGKTPPAQ
jgi:tetratricopeptide (TPR) repeat protein